MAILETLERGSRGDGVRKLQNSLISAGYSVGSTGADGIYGPNTERAVRNYQQAMGLQVDGIAGRETLGSLYGGEQTQMSTGYDPEAEENYRQALAELEEMKGAKPQYAGTYEARLEELYNAMVNRAPFRYDREQDPAYLKYRDQYQRMGQLAMLDALGQGAALTGGYGNSYAQGVSQQAYQGYLDRLSGLESELYAQALDRYDRQGEALSDRYAMLEDLSRAEYDRYQDALQQYRSDLAQSRYRANDAYDRWQDARQLDARQREYELAVQKYLRGK